MLRLNIFENSDRFIDVFIDVFIDTWLQCLTFWSFSFKKVNYGSVSRSSYSFADDRDANITRYCRHAFPACEWVKI